MRAVLSTLLLIVLAMPAAAGEITPADGVPNQLVVSNAISYQGRLTDLGSPVDGTADFLFTLYDAVAGGNIVGSQVSMQNVSVLQGVFNVQLDFGANVFDGNQRFLDIQARTPHDAGNTLPYTALGPRQEFTAVPYAHYALNSAGGGGGGGFWNLVGNVLTNNSGTAALINRSNQITTAEYFGFYAPTASYGGMYISTDSGGKPFYGYSPGGSVPNAWTYQDGGTGDWKIYNSGDRFTVANTGEVKVSNTVILDNSATTNLGGEIRLYKSGGSALGAQINGAGGTGNQGGSITLFNDTNPGTGTAVLDGEYGNPGGGALVLRNETGSTTIELAADLNPGDRGMIRMYQPDGTKTIELDTSETGAADQGATLKLYDDLGALKIELDADYGSGGEGRITTEVIEITGGADFSEQFDVNCASPIEPGSVVSIDAGSAGDLCLSNSAYDRRVAGIVSGAGGVKPGMLMGQRGTEADGRHPVALTGRVYCKVDASFGAIQPGDLLTTSPTTGHAMKVTDASRARGAILGKAMTPLDAGRGLVLVLVSLQ